MPKLTALILLATALSAFQPGSPSGEGEEGARRGPPPEALAACEGLEEAATCSFEGRRGLEEGTCEPPPHGEGELACRPADAPPPPRERPED